MEAAGFPFHRAGESQATVIQSKLALTADQGGIVSFESLVFRQLAHPNMAAVCKIWILYIFLRLFSLQQHPIADQLRTDASLTHRAQVIPFIQGYRVAAGGAAHFIAAALHLVHGAALGAHIKQCIHFFGHLSLAPEGHLGLPVPDIVIVGQQTVHGVLDLLGRQALQLLRGEHPVYRYLHPAHTLIQAVLGIGQVAAGYLGVVHRDAHHLQKLARAGHHRLGHARDGAHSLGHNAQVAALVDDAAHLTHAVQIRGEILLGNDLGQL